MPGPKHSPAAWTQRDHEGKGIAVKDATGQSVCYFHYPNTVQDYANIKVVMKAPELLEKLKSLLMVLELTVRGHREDPKKDSFCIAARRLINECEFTDPVKGRPDETL